MKKLTKRIAVLLMAVCVLLTTCAVEQAEAATKPTALTLNRKSASMTVGDTLKLKVKSVKPTKASKSVKWKSTNTTVATVSQKGVVTAVAAGTVKIKAISKLNKKVSAVCRVTVKKPDVWFNDKGLTLSYGDYVGYTIRTTIVNEDETETLRTVDLPVGVYIGGVIEENNYPGCNQTYLAYFMLKKEDKERLLGDAERILINFGAFDAYTGKKLDGNVAEVALDKETATEPVKTSMTNGGKTYDVYCWLEVRMNESGDTVFAVIANTDRNNDGVVFYLCGDSPELRAQADMLDSSVSHTFDEYPYFGEDCYYFSAYALMGESTWWYTGELDRSAANMDWSF